MYTPNIFGAYDSRQLPTLNLNSPGVSEAQIRADIDRWAAAYNAVADLYQGFLAEAPNEQASGDFGTGTGGGEMQPYTEYGEVEATNVEQSTWDWALPIRRYRDRQIYTEEYLALASLAKIQDDTIAATNRNLSTKIKMLLRALFNNVSWTFTEKKFPGDGTGTARTIRPLFNADGTTARLWVNGAPISAGTLQSYKFSGQAAMHINNFIVGRSELRTRGYTGRVFHIISKSDEDAVRGLTGFIPTPTPPSDIYSEVINPTSPTTQAVVTRPQAIGTIDNGGTANGEVVVFPYFPAGYTMSMDVTKPKPVGIRWHSNAQFRGFRLVQNELGAAYGDGALRNKRWEYIAGAGVKNRANGVIVKVDVAAYSIPDFNA